MNTVLILIVAAHMALGHIGQLGRRQVCRTPPHRERVL